MKRWIAVLVLAALLVGCLPAAALAEESGVFYFSAETSSQLVAAPVQIAYTEGQTIRQALEASEKVTLTTDASSSFITAINGVSGSYVYGSDTGAAIDNPASSVKYFRFSESEAAAAAPSAALQQLMQVMADCLLEEADVRNAAAEAYNQALAAYPGISDSDAASHAQAITAAIAAYQSSQSGTYPVTFSGYSGEGYQVSAENQYGKTFVDADHTGTLSLPAGSYTFFVRQGNLQVSGGITVSGSMTVTAALPQGQWIREDSLRLSSGYDSEFDEGCYTYTLTDHTAVVPVPDSFTGRLYPYVELNVTASLAALYTDTNGQSKQVELTPKSKVTSISNVLTRGTQGNTVLLRASQTGTDGYVQSQDLTLRLDRMPTLSALRVMSGTAVQAADVAFSGTILEYTYRIVSTDTLKLYPTAADSSYQVLVNGTALDSDGGAEVSISGDTDIRITVSGGVYQTDYTLHIRPGAGKEVRFTMNRDTSIVVVNKNEEELGYTRKFEGQNAIYSYTLVPGESYSYVATKGTCYHTKKSITLGENTASGTNYNVSVDAGDWLEALAFGSSTMEKDKGNRALSPTFSSGTHTYAVTVPDFSNTMGVWATAPGKTIEALYRTQSSSSTGVDKSMQITSGKEAGVQLSRLLLSGSAYENTVTIRVSQTSDDGSTHYTDYTVQLERSLSLENMEITCQGSSVTLNQENSGKTGYNRSETDYSVLVPAAASSLELALQARTTARYGDTDSGYEIAVNGAPVTDGTATVTLNGSGSTEIITVKLTNRYNQKPETEYTITVNKAATTGVQLSLSPEDALVYVYEKVTGNRVWPGEDGACALSEGFTYYCSITRKGYVAQSGDLWVSIQSGSTVLTFGERTYDASQPVRITLTAAPGNAAIDTAISAQWPDFRGDASNNAVTGAKTPVSAEDGTLYWAVKLGTGFDSKAVGCPILVDGCLITYAGDQLYRVDQDTGEVLKTGTMVVASSYAINSPTYSDGVILMGLSDGRIQAFNAKTLESLWLYTDPLKGQPNCPIVVHNGYVYTGFWNSETGQAAFVCLPLTDEKPNETLEAKAASWRHIQQGGFYWAGAYVCDDFVLVGTDDGQDGVTSQTSSLLLLDPLTGAVLDRRDGLNGDIRSSVCYDSVSNACYFTSKGGSFYRVRVENKKITALDSLALQNGTTGTPMSTSTPVVYNGRAYVGVSGSSQFSQYSGHNITVIDLSSWRIAYSVPTQGYPQTSGLLTTAYEESNGYVYVYFFDNYTPGTLRILRDKAGQTRADYVTAENGSSGAYALFSPVGEQSQYAICSPIVDSNGTIYFKNDSGYLMAFGSSVVKLQVTHQPTKTRYAAGEQFDKSGLVVTATLANGLTRDVTAMMSAPQKGLTEGTTSVTLELGRGQTMYHNQENSDGTMTAGVTTIPPTVTVRIQVGETTALWGDVNGDGKVDSDDAVLVLRYTAKLPVTIDTAVGDVSGDGKVDSDDAVLLLRYTAKLIDRFPVED